MRIAAQSFHSLKLSGSSADIHAHAARIKMIVSIDFFDVLDGAFHLQS